MTRRTVGIAAGVFLLLCGAALLYHPTKSLPLEVWDYREFLPILEAQHGVVAQWRALLEYYGTHGRMNPLFYLTFVAQFQAFGADATGWQLIRFMVMGANVVLVAGLARRLGASRWGALLAASLFVVATPAVSGWIQLMAEPLALLTLLGAIHLAIDFRVAPQGSPRVLGILAALAALFLLKEVVGVLGALVVVFALLGWPVPSVPDWRRNPRILLLASGALLLALATAGMILTVRHAPRATGYGMAYGSAPLSLSRLGHNVVAILMLVRGEGRALLSLLYPTNLLLLGVVCGACWILMRRSRQPALWYALALGSAIPLVGALAYWPWPKFDAFYALPFFLGPALVLAGTLTVVEGHGRWSAWVGRGAAVLAVAYAAIPASRSVEATGARIELNASVAQLVGRLTSADTVVVLGPTTGPRVLPVRAEELRDYAVALHWMAPDDAPWVHDADCPAYQPDPGGQTLFVSYSYGCGRFPAPRMRLIATFAWRDWLTLTRVVDTLSADLDGGALSRVMPSP
jgi:hypothetical protein